HLADGVADGGGDADFDDASDVAAPADDDDVDNLFEYAPEVNGASVAGQNAPRQPETREEKMADLMEKWLMLMVVQRRVNLFKSIRARV
ncbi:MAG TPA: hypothetical protein DHV36_07570, partial [Desulfobacteraceae bacterium]|nr:hypothetical protein [Desulfobacteraceae bacterium]